MLRKNLKLLVTAVGLGAVLVVGLVVPGATQQIELPTRAQIVKGLSQLVATLTASEGDILDVENAVFGSAPSPKKPYPPDITFAYIPLHPSSRSSQLFHDWLFRDEPFGEHLNVGALYIASDFPGCSGFDPLRAGIYHLKLRQDLKVVAFDSEGNEFVIGYVVKKRQQEQIPDTILRPASPISGAAFILILCAWGDVKICVKTKHCTIVKAPDGSEVTECSETEVCIEC